VAAGLDDIEVVLDDNHFVPGVIFLATTGSQARNATPSFDGHVEDAGDGLAAEGGFQGLGGEARTICKRRK
jgi:hypothetical protein